MEPAPRLDLVEMLKQAALERAAEPAIVGATSELSWAELYDEVSRVATGLAAAGVVAGYRVAIVLGNRPEFVVAYLATLRAGAIAVPINPRATPAELARAFADAGVRLVFADGASAQSVRQACDEIEDDYADAAKPRLVVIGTTLRPGERSYDHLRADRGRPQVSAADPERIAALLYTSGTTGRPRAAMLSHRALVADVEMIASVEPPMIRAGDVVLGLLPLFHVYGLNAVLGSCLKVGARLVLLDRFDPDGTLDAIAAHRCTVLPLAPPVFAHWRGVEDLRERLAGVRLVVSGSAPLSAETIDEFTARTSIPVHQGYGLTEAAPVVTSTLCSAAPISGSVGAALPGIEMRLVDNQGRVVRADSEDEGEVEIRGANLFSGYWPDGADGPDAEGWWATGDVGFLAADGDLFLVDRRSELIIVSGFNVYPAEVEEVIREVPGVAEVAVIGAPEATTGETVVAYVRPISPGSDYALESAVLARCAVRLARFKQPTRVEVVPELPLTVTGKVQRGKVRAHERRQRTPLVEVDQ